MRISANIRCKLTLVRRVNIFNCIQKDRLPGDYHEIFVNIEREDVMKKIHPIGLILILVISTLIGCASSEYIPEGSSKTATFEGSFFGTQFSGTCRIDIFELSDGTQRFEGNLTGEENRSACF